MVSVFHSKCGFFSFLQVFLSEFHPHLRGGIHPSNWGRNPPTFCVNFAPKLRGEIHPQFEWNSRNIFAWKTPLSVGWNPPPNLRVEFAQSLGVKFTQIVSKIVYVSINCRHRSAWHSLVKLLYKQSQEYNCRAYFSSFWFRLSVHFTHNLSGFHPRFKGWIPPLNWGAKFTHN